jgi:hypothetical protein
LSPSRCFWEIAQKRCFWEISARKQLSNGIQNFEESQKVLKSTEPAKVTKLGSLNMDRQLKFHHA